MDAYDFTDEQVAAMDHCNEMLEVLKGSAIRARR